MQTKMVQVATELKQHGTNRGGRKQQHWAVCKTQRRRERKRRGETGGEFQCPDFSGTSYLTWRLWRVLCCGGGGGNSSSWTVAKHVSSSFHSSLLFLSLSLPDPPPTLPLTLLPEFYSKSQSDHLPPAPAQGRGGKFHSLLSVLVGGGGSPQGPEVPSQSVKWPGAIQLHTQQHKHKYFIVLIPVRLLLNLLGWQTCQSLRDLPACLSLCVPVFPSDLSGHISPASLSCPS